MQPTTPQRPVMDVTVRNRTAPAAPPVASPEPKPTPEPVAETTAPVTVAPVIPTPVAPPATSEVPEIPAEPEAVAVPASPALPPESPASIDVHEAPQYEDESEKPALQTADQPKDASATHPEQSEKTAEEPKPAKAEVREQPKPKRTSNVPIGTIVATLFVMAVLAGLTVMVYLQS